MNTQSYQANRRANAEECVAIGDFIFNDERDHLYIVLPRADGRFAMDAQGRAVLDPIRISRTDTDHPRVWKWNGNESAPTLGYLTNGELKSC